MNSFLLISPDQGSGFKPILSGKSTLSKKLSEITGLPLYALDKIKYQSGGAEVPNEEYKPIRFT